MIEDDRPPARRYPVPGELPTAMTWGGVERIGIEAQESMKQIEEEYGASVKVGVVAIVAEVSGEAEIRTFHADDDVETRTVPYTAVDWRCSDHRRWIQRALFDGAARSVGSWR